MTDVKIQLGCVIKQLRIQRGLTQEHLAEKASLHRTYLSDIERGARNPSLETLVRLATALQTSLEEIFKNVESFTSPKL